MLDIMGCRDRELPERNTISYARNRLLRRMGILKNESTVKSTEVGGKQHRRYRVDPALVFPLKELTARRERIGKGPLIALVLSDQRPQGQSILCPRKSVEAS